MFAISIETDLAPDEVRSRLARVVGPRVRNSSATASFRPLVGFVDAASFRIRRRTARRAMWQSKISGRYAAADTGTRIVLDVPAAAPLLVIVLLSAIIAIADGDLAILGLLGVVTVIAAAAVAYDAGRAVSIVRNAVGARGLQRVCAAQSERRIA